MAEINVIGEDDQGNPMVSCKFWSMSEMADYAKIAVGNLPRSGVASWAESGEYSDWRGGTWREILDLAHNGWSEHLQASLDLIESAVSMCEQEHEQFTFSPVFDVAGGDVDVARFLAGEPECMVDYPLTVTSKVGRVITLCANVGYSSAISPATIIRRGQVITALALALSRLGHAVELWLDQTITSGGRTAQIRTLIKGPDDVLDPEHILFAFAHPTVQRALVFAVQNGMVKTRKAPTGIGTGYGKLRGSIEDLPEGTIYLPELMSNRDIENAPELLERYLSELGLIES